MREGGYAAGSAGAFKILVVAAASVPPAEKIIGQGQLQLKLSGTGEIPYDIQWTCLLAELKPKRNASKLVVISTSHMVALFMA